MISNKYKINDKISTGSYGMVYNGVNVRTNEQVAIKIIKKEDEIVFKNECSIYKFLTKDKNFAQLKWISITEDYYVLVMSLLGPSITYLKSIELTNADFKQLAINLFYKIDLLHSYNIIHRDIKPNNIVLNRNNLSDLYLVDFSYSTFIIDEFFQLKPNKGIDNVIGSGFYCSLNIHMRDTPSRRDDLESACYVLGNLIDKTPWLHCKYEKNIILEKQQFPKIVDVDWLKDLYDEIRGLKFNETISFECIKNIIDKTT